MNKKILTAFILIMLITIMMFTYIYSNDIDNQLAQSYPYLLTNEYMENQIVMGKTTAQLIFNKQVDKDVFIESYNTNVNINFNNIHELACIAENAYLQKYCPNLNTYTVLSYRYSDSAAAIEIQDQNIYGGITRKWIAIGAIDYELDYFSASIGYNIFINNSPKAHVSVTDTAPLGSNSYPYVGTATDYRNYSAILTSANCSIKTKEQYDLVNSVNNSISDWNRQVEQQKRDWRRQRYGY